MLRCLVCTHTLLLLVLFHSQCEGNSAGVGIPCSMATQGEGSKLGHPTRGGLQGYQVRITAASEADKAAIKEERLEHMHSLESQGYIMFWALQAKHSGSYTVRTGDGPTGDPTSYIPEQWMSIYVKSLVEGKQLTGLIMYAVNVDDDTVGEWQVDPGTPFRYGEDANGAKCVTHSNAEIKHYLNVFRFKAPSRNTGPITFKAMVKVGLAFPVLQGAFYWPNVAGHLELTEGASETKTWFQGEPGESCDQVCSRNGGGCDLQTLKLANTSQSLRMIVEKFTNCTPPLMGGCSATVPAMGTEGCFYHDDTCFERPPLPPAPVPQNPCEGLAAFGGNEQTITKDCVKWKYQNQNNGALKDEYNQQYGNAQNVWVKVCPAGGKDSARFKNQDRLNNNDCEITDECPPGTSETGDGVFVPPTTAPTPLPPPRPLKAKVSCSAKDDDLKDGARLCACDRDIAPSNDNPSGVACFVPQLSLVSLAFAFCSWAQHA